MIWQSTRRVEFHHCDPAGMVFYPRYLEMMNSVIEQFFREGLDYGYGPMHMDQHKGVPTVKLELDFQAPGLLEDLLDFTLEPVRLGTSSLELSVVCTCQNAPRFTARSTMVQIDTTKNKSTPWPEAMRHKLQT